MGKGLPKGSSKVKTPGPNLRFPAKFRLHSGMQRGFDEDAILRIERPHPQLWTYYILRCLAFPPLAPITLVYHWFRYHSMRYQFTPEGVSMSWGVLFRHEILLNYARIQDIHLESNVVERWLGLARLQIQTASGSQSAEMTIEGLPEFEAVRDFLYSRMRGVRDAALVRPEPSSTPVRTSDHPAPESSPELASVLREVAAELRELRRTLETAQANSNPPTRHG